MITFSGATIFFDADGSMQQTLLEGGEQAVIYQLLEKLPFAGITALVFLFIVFISYVTAADSNTSAMTGMSVHGITPENPEAPHSIKIIWGALVGFIAWIMISFAGIDGIKMTSNLGGFPALFVILLVGLGLLKVVYSKKAQK